MEPVVLAILVFAAVLLETTVRGRLVASAMELPTSSATGEISRI